MDHPSTVPCQPDDRSLERFRPYLLMLARNSLAAGRRAALDPSDLVQQTLLDAHRGLKRFLGNTSAELAAWLRTILARRLADAHRLRGRAGPLAGQVHSLEEALAHSSLRLAGLLADSGSSPSQQAQRHEAAVQIAAALAQLPESQRTALVLQHWQGWPLSRIASHMRRSPAAVAGLIKRGLRQLRQLLPEPE